ERQEQQFHLALLRSRPRGKLDLPLGREPGLQLTLPLQLGVHLLAEEDGDVRDPQPRQEDNHAAEAAVRLVVREELHVQREQRRRRDPYQHRENAAWRDPFEAWLLDVRRGE